MRTIAFILGLLAFSNLHSQADSSARIVGISMNWFGQLQDIGPESNLKISNTSIIVMSDSTTHEASPEDPLTWIWNRRLLTDAVGHYETVVLDTAFDITASEHIDVLCHGVFIIELIAIHDDGRVWATQGPCRIIWNVNVPPCDQIPGLIFSWFDEDDYLNADQLTRTFTSALWYEGKDYIGELGDLDNDGDVDMMDLLLFLGKYGN